MSLLYKLAYRVGFAPWEHAGSHQPAAHHVAMLFEREEQSRQAPYGAALDLGCGRGHWSILLAQRGWEVTGIDLSLRAVRAAAERARRAHANVRLLHGDATAMRAAGVGPGLRLIWDFGTVHGLSPRRRQAVGEEISALAADDATVLILAWSPSRRGPLPRGASRQDIQRMLPAWDITNDEPFDATGLPRPLRNVRPRMYRLRRAGRG